MENLTLTSKPVPIGESDVSKIVSAACTVKGDDARKQFGGTVRPC